MVFKGDKTPCIFLCTASWPAHSTLGGVQLVSRVGCIQDAREADRPALGSHLTPLLDITRSYLDGVSAHAHEIGMSLFEAFLNVEESFQRGSEATEQEIIDELRQACTLLLPLSVLLSSDCNAAAMHACAVQHAA